MENNSDKRKKNKLIYRISLIAAALCICGGVIAANSIRARKNAHKYDVSVQPAQIEEKSSAPVSKPETGVPKTAPSASAVKKSAASTPVYNTGAAAKKAETASEAAFNIESLKFKKPADGKIAAAHSGDKLVYNKFFDDWRVHSGVDICAQPSAQVKAVYAGSVESVEPDGTGGFKIVINSGFFKTVYSGLSTDKLTEKSKNVAAGDVISGIRDKATVYELPHMNFEVIYQGKSIDPEPFFE